MKKQLGLLLSAVGLVLLIVQGAWAFELITRDVIEKQIITNVDFIKTADNFVIFFDGSSNANQLVPGTNMTKIAAAKMLLAERNQILPDLGYRCGLYLLSGFTALKTIQEMQPYDRAAFGRAIDQLPDKGEGNSLLQPALLKLEKILEGLTGRTSVILFTDGTYTETTDPRKPLEIAQSIAAKHNVQFYVISSAERDNQRKMVKKVASINAGSRVIPVQAFLVHPEYLSGALFTVKVTSYTKLTARPEVVGFTTKDILFDSNSDMIRAEYREKLDKLGAFLKDNPKSFVVLQGFSDASGSEERNLAISEKRVVRVSRHLTALGVGSDRIVTLWYGQTNPAGDNNTKEGRQLNRRVEIAVGGL
ncbi:MAG: OmpA family protein [Desulfobacteraceae bacterium]|nr:OmpA family protein [Desulfobacteraceae bacterium]